MKRRDKFQFVNWFPEWQGIGFERLREAKHGSLAHIYCWVLWLGWFEVRRWKEEPGGVEALALRMAVERMREAFSVAAREIVAAFRFWGRSTTDEYREMRREAYKRGVEAIRSYGWILEKDKRARVEKRLREHLKKYSERRKGDA